MKEDGSNKRQKMTYIKQLYWELTEEKWRMITFTFQVFTKLLVHFLGKNKETRMVRPNLDRWHTVTRFQDVCFSTPPLKLHDALSQTPGS